jgi:hypothetical protein
MDSDIRLQQINFHQQQLRAEAAAERLARGRQDRHPSPYPTTHLPRTIRVLRRLVGGSAA